MKQHIESTETDGILEIYAREKKSRQLKKKLAKGYEEMAKINLEIANEWLETDNNTQENYEKLISGV